MIKSSLALFQRNVQDLTDHIDRCEKNTLLLSKYRNVGDADAAAILAESSKERIYNYRANTITLYGLFEQFIEGVVKEYLHELCRIYPVYSNLNKKLKENYPDLSFSLFKKLDWPKFAHLKQEQITESLYKTINLDLSDVQEDAFLQKSGNYRFEEIDKAFKNFGVTTLANELRRYEPLKSEFVSKYGDPAYKAYETSTLYQTLDDLVERRNDIAHGVNQFPIVRDNDFKTDYINFAVKIATALNTFLNNLVLSFEYQNLRSFAILHVYCGNTVAGMELDSIKIHVGQKIIIKRPKGFIPEYEQASICEIQHNGASLPDIDITSQIQLGLKLDCSVSQGCEIAFM